MKNQFLFILLTASSLVLGMESNSAAYGISGGQSLETSARKWHQVLLGSVLAGSHLNPSNHMHRYSVADTAEKMKIVQTSPECQLIVERMNSEKYRKELEEGARFREMEDRYKKNRKYWFAGGLFAGIGTTLFIVARYPSLLEKLSRK